MSDFIASEITKDFDSPAGPLRVLDQVSIELNRQENLAILGPSGSGKSTFLHIAGTLDQPTSGNIQLLGTNPANFSDKELARFRNDNIGFVFQDHYLLPQLSALENVLVPTVANGRPNRNTIGRAAMLLDRVGLAQRRDQRPGTLSGGERQRVAVARALIRQPLLLLADEPTGNLDQGNAEIIGKLLLDLQYQENTILICVTHSDQLAKLFKKSVRLENGKFC
jgi:lipoprotein-releasing system ATP-binding protein